MNWLVAFYLVAYIVTQLVLRYSRMENKRCASVTYSLCFLLPLQFFVSPRVSEERRAQNVKLRTWLLNICI